MDKSILLLQRWSQIIGKPLVREIKLKIYKFCFIKILKIFELLIQEMIRMEKNAHNFEALEQKIFFFKLPV